MVDLYEEAGINENNAINLQPNGLTVILFVGVNGVGKTTSIGKLAHQYKLEGKKVLMAAADTFRAGAIDQLVVWGERAGVEVVRECWRRSSSGRFRCSGTCQSRTGRCFASGYSRSFTK